MLQMNDCAFVAWINHSDKSPQFSVFFGPLNCYILVEIEYMMVYHLKQEVLSRQRVVYNARRCLSTVYSAGNSAVLKFSPACVYLFMFLQLSQLRLIVDSNLARVALSQSDQW